MTLCLGFLGHLLGQSGLSGVQCCLVGRRLLKCLEGYLETCLFFFFFFGLIVARSQVQLKHTFVKRNVTRLYLVTGLTDALSALRLCTCPFLFPTGLKRPPLASLTETRWNFSFFFLNSSIVTQDRRRFPVLLDHLQSNASGAYSMKCIIHTKAKWTLISFSS